jgi:hypothetical protein
MGLTAINLWSAAAVAAAALPLLITPAAAQLFNSSYSTLKFEECTVITSDDFGSTWACPGLKGMPVMVRESERRFRVSYGLTSTTEKAAEQTLPPVNSLADEIEWRVSNAEGSYKPFATILKFLTKPEAGSNKPEGEVLVVTKVSPGATCHVAYIDALANPDAQALALKAADEKAKDFDCANPPEIIGTFEAYKP